ncbi:probable LRR receptor-like serine/threonine-protein kinase At1g56130 [Oryza glaberrima]|uniref:probable LRR receptor-like serine/threonine-protein kinase At1g56130 n=1 Tax=Oryza glaberrima TaxID=4538 RepID=UPI00224C2837|nr:probable LRR receptor-like serine/threonine-protein kinase At1g56130 [Oryza glaberrima]
MASPAAPFALLLLLVSLAIAAAQQLPSRTNSSDAAALHAVFKQWKLQGDPAPPAYDPCEKLIWHNSSAMEASINCSCAPSTPPPTTKCRITHLNVTGFRNITFIPEELFNLTELVSLDLSNNNLSGPITPNIANLTKLEIWHFNNNQLRGPFPNGSSSLRNLQSLWMFDNNIDGKVPEFIADFTNLKDLRIYGMKLRGPIPNKFSNMANLTYLMIGDLDGDNFPFDFIGDWANISVLSLRKCGLFGELHRPLPNVTYLDLRSNNLTGPIKQVLQDNRRVQHLYVGENKFDGSLPPQMPPSLLALDVTYNPLLNGSLSNIFSDGRNYIGTSIVSGSNHGEEVSLLNCLDMKECNQTVNNTVPFAVNCGGKEYTSDLLQTVFHDDSTDLRSAGFHIDSSNSWVVSHVGADPFSNSTGIVNTTKNISGTDMLELYRTARTSTGSLWYYVVGLTSGRYTVQLFFAEIVIESESGRRLFNIDIQDQNIRADFDIFKEAGGFNKSTNINYTANVTTSVLKIHLYWNGRGTCCIPRNGTYGPLISAIRVFPYTEAQASPPPAPHTSRRDEKRRGVVAGIAALSIAAAVISSSVVYLWWKWVSLVKHRKA